MTPRTNDFTSGTNPLGPSNKAKNAIRSHVRNISTSNARYLSHLKGYIAKKEGIDEACISFGYGSTAILSTVLKLAKPKRILIPYPLSHRRSAIVLKYCLESMTVPLRVDENFDLNVEDFCNAMDGCDAAILPNPHDITGSVVIPEDAMKIVAEAERLGIHLFLDEAYTEYTGMHSLAAFVAKSRRAMIIRTFSTFHALGGLRLGYIIGPANFVSLIESVFDPSLINLFAPQAAIASMKDKGYLRKTLLFIEDEKSYLLKKISEIKNVKCYASPTNILVIGLQQGHTDLGSFFRKYHILIQTFTDEDGNTCIRFPVQTHRMNAYFVRSLKKIMEA
jgi:histidinol-phosphate/aromatic aminotransferase/cobyric acid decarboxylase-like protein